MRAPSTTMVEFRADEQVRSITFRIAWGLKKQLESVAQDESRIAALVCEAFLRPGSESYEKKGLRFLQRFLVQGNQRGTLS